MLRSITDKVYCRLVAVTLFLFSGAGNIFASGLTIDEATRLAITEDYTLQSLRARGESMSELAVATERLPDPQLKLGFANLPTDTFNLGQEPMTQTVIGLRQKFPRGQTRSLSSKRIYESADRISAESENHALSILLATREEYIRIYLHQERRKILEQSLVRLFVSITPAAAHISRKLFTRNWNFPRWGSGWRVLSNKRKKHAHACPG
jgi:hypothetical protein